MEQAQETPRRSRHGSMETIATRMVGCVLVLRVSGLLLAQGLATIRDMVAGEPDICGAVIDMRGIVFAFGDDDLRAVSARGLPPIPVALVTRDDCFDLIRQHALRAAHAGFRRRVFSEPALALQWVQQEAARRAPACQKA